MVGPNDDSIMRRLEALERATDKRLDDARDLHRREHDAADASHVHVHSAADTAHERVHATEKESRDLSRIAMDKRLEGMNEIRNQLITQASSFQTLAAADVEHKGLHSRIDEMRERIINIEKGDVKQEGRQLGQGTVVAIIVTAIAFVGTILGIISVVANLATGIP